MKKRLVFLVLLLILCCGWIGCNLREKQSDYWEGTSNLVTTIRTLQMTVFLEEANLEAGIEYPESIEKQKELFSSLMQYLKENDEIWESSVFVADDVCGLMYIDAFFGKEHHDFLLEKLSPYVYDRGLLSTYHKGEGQVSEEEIMRNVQTTAYNLNYLSEALSEEELKQFGFREAIVHYFNYYLPEASETDGDQKEERIGVMQGMYSEILCVLPHLALEEKLDFTSIQDLQQQKSRRNFEERFAETSLYNASMWAMIAREEQVYHESNRYDAYANQMFCNLKTEEEFHLHAFQTPFSEVRFFLLSGGTVTGNEFYSSHVNEWIDEEITMLYRQWADN